MPRILLVAMLLAVAENAPPPRVASLSWMAGSWSGEEHGALAEEVWMEPKGGLMLGQHRDLKGGKAVAWEFLRIQDDETGTVYWGSPMGVTPTPFRLVEQGPQRAVFANPEHDFPKRILYWLDGDGALHARVDAGEGTKGPEWRWTRGR
jgi:hypothetical protein